MFELICRLEVLICIRLIFFVFQLQNEVEKKNAESLDTLQILRTVGTGS